MDEMTKQVVAGIIRHIIGFAAGAMGLEWFLSPDVVNGLVTIALAGVAVGWSWLNKVARA